MRITHETKVGDKVEHDGEKGKVKEIQGEGARRVAVVEIPVTSVKTVYVAIPPPPEQVVESPNQDGPTEP